MLFPALVALGLVAGAAVPLASAPPLWVLAAWALALLLLLAARAIRGRRSRALLFGSAVAVAGLGALEVFAATMDADRVVVRKSDGFSEADEVLGYRPAPGAATARATKGGAEVYDVTYTIGSDRLRISPAASSAARGCVLFFGCSVTFGVGLDDAETFPYRVGEMTGGAYRVYNFGFSGYGPQQMLAALDQGLVDRTISCLPTHLVYTTFPGHVLRAVGAHSWNRHDPRYELKEDGTVVQRGRFDDDYLLPGRVHAGLDRLIGNSFLLARLSSTPRRPTASDFALWRAMVRSARASAARRYPQSEFHVLLWGFDDPETNEMKNALIEDGFATHMIAEMLPDFAAESSRYVLPDGHPNALSADRIAGHVVRQILRQPSGGDGS